MENNYHYFIEAPTMRKIFPVSLKYTQEDGFMVTEAIGYNKTSIVNYTVPIDIVKLENPPLWLDEIPDAPSTKNVQLWFDNSSSKESGSASMATPSPCNSCSQNSAAQGLGHNICEENPSWD